MLLPCPFCNGQRGEPRLEHLLDDQWRVICYGCLIKTIDEITKDGAIRRWNNRLAAPEPAGELRNILGVSMAEEFDANIAELRRDGRFKMAANLEFWKNKFIALAALEGRKG